MRDIHVVGLTSDASHVICTDSSGQRFRIAADETLRAAARGDTARLGQIEIEMDMSIRPREIQARIRAGASVAQVAKESSMPYEKIDRYAYPVLLERARAAELAQLGHPVRKDGPAVLTLAEIVALAFRGRGHSMDGADWDAWKDDDGHWVVQLHWQAGRTANAAHWRFTPDAHGGSIEALDDAAHELIDPDFGRQLRPVGSREPAPSQQTLDDYYGVDSVHPAEVAPMPVEHPEGEPARAADGAADDGSAAPTARPAQAHPSAKGKRGKPAMPSWEDVLLGVRGNGR